MIPQPLIVLAPPFGDASRVAAILGSHPQACLVPELNLTLAGRVGDLLDVFALANGGYEQGLLRAVAEWFCGGQNEAGIEGAWEWLRRRADRSCELLLSEIAERVSPRQVVMPDSSAVLRPDLLRLLNEYFPAAPWLQVLIHPRLYCAQALPNIQHRLHFAPDFRDYRMDPPLLDPQMAWYRMHLNVQRAMAQRQPDPCHVVRAEQLYSAPEDTLSSLCQWLGWSADPASIALMMRPEDGDFSYPGPHGAPGGLDADFLQNPGFMRRMRPLVSLDGPLEWRTDGLDFMPETKQLAQQYRYV